MDITIMTWYGRSAVFSLPYLPVLLLYLSQQEVSTVLRVECKVELCQKSCVNDPECQFNSPSRPPYDGDCLGGTPKKSCPILSRYWRAGRCPQGGRGERGDKVTGNSGQYFKWGKVIFLISSTILASSEIGKWCISETVSWTEIFEPSPHYTWGPASGKVDIARITLWKLLTYPCKKTIRAKKQHTLLSSTTDNFCRCSLLHAQAPEGICTDTKLHVVMKSDFIQSDS